jgi:hypothetical protein
MFVLVYVCTQLIHIIIHIIRMLVIIMLMTSYSS